MEKIIGNILSLIIGCILVFFRSFFAHKVIEQQNKFWGFNFGGNTLRATEALSIIVGIGFIVFGLIPLLVDAYMLVF